MATFVAFQKVDTTFLGEFSILENPPQLVTDTATTSTLRVHNGNVAFEYTSAANDFTYGHPGPPDGTIRTLEVLVAGDSAYRFSDLSLQFDDLLAHVDLGKNDIPGAMAALFNGDDKITGSKFNDILAGFDGNDVLKGGKGKDIFLFNAAFGPGNVDKVKDFNTKDKLGIDHDLIGLSPGAKLGQGALRVGSKAKDASDHFIYDAAKGRLYYDGDGNGSAKQVLVAILQEKPEIGVHDFLIV